MNKGVMMMTGANNVDVVDSSVFQNDNYVVFVSLPDSGTILQDGVEYDEYYEAVNRNTGVTELRHTCLPVVLFNVERWSLDLEKSSHLYARSIDQQVQDSELLAEETEH
jgi:hypothetical protein